MKAIAAGALALFLLCAAPLSARTGQWIWTRGDLALYRERAAKNADLEAGVFIATVHGGRDGVILKRALSPALVANLRAVVVRFDDSFHAAWKDAAFDDTLTAGVARLLTELLKQVAAAGASPAEIQLDYDCPERLLARWAAMVRTLGSGALNGREVWITSLPSHLRHDDFGKLFADSVAGHIPQVFDTGLRFSPEAAAALKDRLDRTALPFRLGMGAFERGDSTDHGRWRAALPLLEASSYYRGLWIFPAGQPWNAPPAKGLL